MTMKRNSKANETGIGNILKSLRIIRELTVKELADRLELSSSYICDVEANRKKLSLDMLERYSSALGVNRSTLLLFDEQGKEINYNHQKLLLIILQSLEKSEN